jgi:hypothetical protein
MSEHCIDCGKTVDPTVCYGFWDDGQALFQCPECCEAAEIDNLISDEMMQLEKEERDHGSDKEESPPTSAGL